MSVCGQCGFNIRGKGHFEGEHHKGPGRPKASKTQMRLWGRQTDFEKTRISLGSSWKIGMMRNPGSLQIGRCR